MLLKKIIFSLILGICLSSAFSMDGPPPFEKTQKPRLGIQEMTSPKDQEKYGVYLVKARTAKEFAPEETLPEGTVDPVAGLYGCNIHGFYVAYKDRERIGTVTLSDGTGTYYEDKASLLGFTEGSWVDHSVFLHPSQVGKGYLQRITTAIRKDLTDKFIGKHHRVGGALCLSSSPFQGLRGIIDLSNVPALRASLKNQSSLLDLWEEQDFWIVQSPPKRAEDLTLREKELIVIANKIIDESLESFTGKTIAGKISSTEEARGAVREYYYQSNYYLNK